MENLIVYESPYQKFRTGRPYDGGYVISVLPGTYDAFLSCGINDDISFEQHLMHLYPYLTCTAFDGTIDNLPYPEPKIIFVKKNIGPVNSETITNLHEYIEPHNDIFLKVDIEGHEFDSLNTFSEDQFKKIKQLVIEIHTPADIDLFPEYFKGLSHITNDSMFGLLKKINTTHTLVHIHGNNFCKRHSINDIVIPNVFECTFIRNDYIQEKITNKAPVPTNLDMPNVPNKPECNLSYWPFMSQ